MVTDLQQQDMNIERNIKCSISRSEVTSRENERLNPVGTRRARIRGLCRASRTTDIGHHDSKIGTIKRRSASTVELYASVIRALATHPIAARSGSGAEPIWRKRGGGIGCRRGGLCIRACRLRSALSGERRSMSSGNGRCSQPLGRVRVSGERGQG